MEPATSCYVALHAPPNSSGPTLFLKHPDWSQTVSRNHPHRRRFLFDTTWENPMSERDNMRETGARKLAERKSPDATDTVSQEAAANKPPRDGMGLTSPADADPETMRQSDGRDGHGGDASAGTQDKAKGQMRSDLGWQPSAEKPRN